MSSFWQNLQEAKAEYGTDHPVWEFNGKIESRTLAQRAGVQPPALITGPCALPWLLLPPITPVAMKPAYGCSSRGVSLLVPTGGDYRDLLRDGLHSWEQVVTRSLTAEREARNQALLHINHPDAVRGPWLMEELLLRPDGTAAHDWKCFVIGGRVHAVMQIARTPDGNRSKWYSPGGVELGDIHPGSYWTYDPTLPPPCSMSRLVADAERIAALIPAAALRVDLFDSEDGPIFGEITPVPLGGNSRFIPEWDQRLGAAWDAAKEG